LKYIARLRFNLQKIINSDKWNKETRNNAIKALESTFPLQEKLEKLKDKLCT